MNPENENDLLNDIADLPNFGFKLASKSDRLGAAIVESIILYIPMYFIVDNSSLFFNYNFFDLPSMAIDAGIAAALGAVFYNFWSGNLGHKIFNMKVISAVDGADQKNMMTGALREGLKSVLGLFLIPNIWILWDSKNQNLYDKIVKTLVVKNY